MDGQDLEPFTEREAAHGPTGSRDVSVALWRELPPDLNGYSRYADPFEDDDPLVPATAQGRFRREHQRIVTGEEAVRDAGESLAGTLAAVTAGMSAALNRLPSADGVPEGWRPDSVDVTFTIRLGDERDTLFVPAGQESAQVVVRFVRTPQARS